MTVPTSDNPSKEALPTNTLLWCVLIGIGLAWGLVAPIGKHAVSSGYHPLVASFWNVAAAALSITLIAALTRRKLVATRQTIFFFLVCGLLGRALPITLAYIAFAQLPVGTVVMLISTTPLLTLIVAVVVKIDALNLHKAIGLFLGLGAVAAIVLPGADNRITFEPIKLLVPLLIALSYAVEGTFIKSRKPEALDPISMVLGSTWAAALMLLPFAFAQENWFILGNLTTIEAAIVGGAVVHLCGYLAFVWLIGQAGPVFASQVGYIVTVSGVLFGIALFDERYPATVWFALAALLLGLALVKPRK